MNARLLALALAISSLAPAAAAANGIDDDYPAALAQARARNVPLVVDVWAPW
jgi:hypothetical protein